MSFLDKVPVVSSYRQSSEADEIVERAKSRARRAERRLADAQSESKRIVDELVDDKLEYTDKLIPTALETLRKCQKINELDSHVGKQAYIQFDKAEAPRLKAQAIEFKDVAKTGVKGTTTGAALALGSMSAVSTLGTASTGTAIATLSGAAAQNATLAWFGGGAISAGGAGMAGGTLVLGGIALAPLAVFGAVKYAKHAEKKMTAAVEYRNEVKTYVEKTDVLVEVAFAMNSHVQSYQKTLRKIADRLKGREKLLTDALQNQESANTINRYKLEVILLLKTLKRLMAIDLVDKQQQPTQKSLHAINKATALTDECIASFVDDMVSGQKSLNEMKGQQSVATYFWFSKENKQRTSIYSKEDKDTLLGSLLVIPVFGWLCSYLLDIHWDFFGTASGFIAVVMFLVAFDTLTKGIFSKIIEVLIVGCLGFAIYFYGWVL